MRKEISLPISEFADDVVLCLFSPTANCMETSGGGGGLCCKSILLSSRDGAISTAQGRTLGQYDMAGEMNGKPYYTRERPGGQDLKYYFYMNSKTTHLARGLATRKKEGR